MDLKLSEKPVRQAGSDSAMEVLELVRDGKLTKRTALELLRRVDPQTVGIALGSAAAVCTAVTLLRRRHFYRKSVAKELKKQLAPIHEKLDALQEENEQLHRELAGLRAE